MKLLKLTHINGTIHSPATIDFDQVCWYKKDNNGTLVYINSENSSCALVRESKEQIDEALESIFGVKAHEIPNSKVDNDNPSNNPVKKLGFGV